MTFKNTLKYILLFFLFSACSSPKEEGSFNQLNQNFQFQNAVNNETNTNLTQAERKSIYAKVAVSINKVGYVQTRVILRKDNLKGERINIGFLPSSNKFFCNKQMIVNPDIGVLETNLVFGRVDYHGGCGDDHGTGEYVIEFNIKESGYEGIYQSKISLPKRFDAQNIDHDTFIHLKPGSFYDFEWEQGPDPINASFSITLSGSSGFPFEYLSLINQDWDFDEDPGIFAIQHDDILDLDMKSVYGRFILVRTLQGEHDPRLLGESLGHSWISTNEFRISIQE